MSEVQTVLDGFSFFECPRWHDGRLWLSDFYGGRVISAGENGDWRVELEVPGQPGGLGWLPDGQLVAVSRRDRLVLRRGLDGATHVHANLWDLAPANLNDMVLDAEGRAYIGNLGFDVLNGDPLTLARLIRVDPDGSARPVADGLYFPNGSVFLDSGELLVAETYAQRLTAFTVAADGSLARRRTFASFGPAPTATNMGAVTGALNVGPDGICLDAEGAVWVADSLHGRALRVLSDGKIADEVKVPDGCVFAVALGGSDGHVLYLCNAPMHSDDRAAELSGKLLAVRVRVPAQAVSQMEPRS